MKIQKKSWIPTCITVHIHSEHTTIGSISLHDFDVSPGVLVSTIRPRGPWTRSGAQSRRLRSKQSCRISFDFASIFSVLDQYILTGLSSRICFWRITHRSFVWLSFFGWARSLSHLAVFVEHCLMLNHDFLSCRSHCLDLGAPTRPRTRCDLAEQARLPTLSFFSSIPIHRCITRSVQCQHYHVLIGNMMIHLILRSIESNNEMKAEKKKARTNCDTT